ncbi:long-chain fatty acid--CoA ligase [Halovenus amylolytica]|uniref:long-chain fatty acid--CoA ligase n=1 Tax=Halovenus amylolytica TaxID=2500550 RepID=UPI003D6A71CE
MMGGYDQTLEPFLWRAETIYPDREVVARTHEGINRYTYAEYADRTRQLANALDGFGIGEGDRVGTFCWNHDRHFETYFGVPNMGAQLHTINPLLPDKHIQHIVEDASDRLIFLDPSLAEKLGSASDPDAFESVEQFVVVGSTVPDVSLEPLTDYESFVSDQSTEYDWPELSEDDMAGMCYTSGTTGKPKGVEYTQQMMWSHTMAMLTPQALGIEDSDVVMPVVPMFHVNAWGMPFTATAAGAKQVFPGPAPEPADLASLIEEEGVTITAGVPTVWLGLLEYMKENEVDLSSLEQIVIGGAAAPKAVIEQYDEFGVDVIHAWGMTETSPVGTVSRLTPALTDAAFDTKVDKWGKQGLIMPGIEFKVVDDDGSEIPHDGEAFGELLVRGPWVTTEYYERPHANETDFDGSWLRTGDIVTVDDDGYIEIVDRAEDVIKSGGEWISSQELENAIMAHEDVSEAAVIGVDHDRWQERPVAMIVVADDVDREMLTDELKTMLQEEYPKWWLPDGFEFIDEIPKTATGKFSKMDLREQYEGKELLEEDAPADAAPEDD